MIRPLRPSGSLSVRSPAAASHAGGGGPVGLLSVFLLLLTFFTVLTAGASYEAEKVDRVVSGMRRAFNAELGFVIDPALLEPGAPAVTAREGGAPGPGAFRASLVRLFSTEFAVGRVTDIRRGERILVTLPADELFASDGSLLAARFGLLDRLAEALGSAPEGLRYEATLRLGLPHGADAETQALVRRRAAAFAQAAMRQGVAAASLRAGFEPGPLSDIRLDFSIRAAEDGNAP
jgi:hypothetical protein